MESAPRLAWVELLGPGGEVGADFGDADADVGKVVVFDASVRAECLREDGQVEGGVGLRCLVERFGAVELLVEQIDVDEVAGFCASEEWEPR